VNVAEPQIRTVGIVDVELGENVTIVEPVNLYGCVIGDECFIGPFVEIQRGVRIGSRVRVQSHAFICELVTIGPARGDRSQYRPTAIGNGVAIGTNATILPVTVADGCVIGAGSVVTRDLAERGVYAGNPARLIRAV
jgi:acetyltransferase-like isoleucine patch superfamily enzyme